jgi:hypothetical protein
MTPARQQANGVVSKLNLLHDRLGIDLVRAEATLSAPPKRGEIVAPSTKLELYNSNRLLY